MIMTCQPPFQTSKYQLLAQLEDSEQPVNAILFSRDGKFIAGGGMSSITYSPVALYHESDKFVR